MGKDLLKAIVNLRITNQKVGISEISQFPRMLRLAFPIKDVAYPVMTIFLLAVTEYMLTTNTIPYFRVALPCFLVTKKKSRVIVTIFLREMCERDVND